MTLTMIDPGTEYPLAERCYWDEETGYLIVLETDGSGYSAYLPELPGVVSAGETEDEVRALMPEAIALHLDGMRAEGEPIPEPGSR